MSRTRRTLAVTALALLAATQAPPAGARPAETFSYDVAYETSVCDETGTLEGRVFLLARSTGSEGGTYTSTFVDRTTGTFTVGDDVYRYVQASKFSDHEQEENGDSEANHLIGWIKLGGAGPLAGTKLQQHINTVVDANGVTRVDTYVSSFCQ
jgi:hypothetical protein